MATIPLQKTIQRGDPYLMFQVSFPLLPVKELVVGKLAANYGKTSVAHPATSGCPRFQCKEGEFWRAKGQLPQPKSVEIEGYLVSLNPVHLTLLRGVEGNFYPITPKWVQIGPRVRGNFGIHMDKNVSSSAGCIVITMENHWRKLEDWFKVLKELGYTQVALYTGYSYT